MVGLTNSSVNPSIKDQLIERPKEYEINTVVREPNNLYVIDFNIGFLMSF